MAEHPTQINEREGPEVTRPKLKQATPLDLALAGADAYMAAAKSMFSRAAAACLAGRIDAELQVRAALDAVDQARAALRAISDQDSEGAE